MRIGIVGCGLIGKKRAKAIAGGRLVACADTDRSRAEALAAEWPGTIALDAWKPLVESPEVDLVVVSTTHAALPEIAHAAVVNGKHVLVEKPAARRASELEPLMAAAAETGVLVRVGYNHRFHPALQKAKELVDGGAIGPLLYVRGRYGHGGRIGYEKEWRARSELSGGGELVDQGVHLIDLARWFLGDFVEVHGFAPTFFWNMEVDDNAFLLLRTAEGRVAHLHASWTEWKNLFSFEVFGTVGKLEITGLGGSYGTERLVHYQMKPEMGPPDVFTFDFPGNDSSWALEFGEFLNDIRTGRPPSPGLADAHAALRIVQEVYEKGRSQR